MLFVSLDTLVLPDTLYDSIDGVELRLDLFPSIDFQGIQSFLQECKKPVMLTLRSISHGGKAIRDELLLRKLLLLKPAFFDLEVDLPSDFLRETISSHPATEFVLSHHAIQTPLDEKSLEEIYSQMEKHDVFNYKIATQVLSTTRALELLLLARQKEKLSLICMGEHASFARVLGPICGNLIDFAALDEKSKTAPGQLTVSEFVDVYRYSHLNKKTALYGLIGDPVDKSQGHLYHNNVFCKKDINAVYVKMKVEPQELPDFFPLAKQIGFKGLSVTMPLKEAVYPWTQAVDSNSTAMQAVNTLLLQKDKILSTNTDGKGALDAIEKRGLVKDKTLLLIGAGGAAKSIAFEAKTRGAHVWIFNRTKEKAKDLASDLDCGFAQELSDSYDVVINCAPEVENFNYVCIAPSTLVMDVVYVPRQTPFLQKAKELGAQIIYGEEMFWNQAAAQTNFWL